MTNEKSPHRRDFLGLGLTSVFAALTSAGVLNLGKAEAAPAPKIEPDKIPAEIIKRGNQEPAHVNVIQAFSSYAIGEPTNEILKPETNPSSKNTAHERICKEYKLGDPEKINVTVTGESNSYNVGNDVKFVVRRINKQEVFKPEKGDKPLMIRTIQELDGQAQNSFREVIEVRNPDGNPSRLIIHDVAPVRDPNIQPQPLDCKIEIEFKEKGKVGYRISNDGKPGKEEVTTIDEFAKNFQDILNSHSYPKPARGKE